MLIATNKICGFKGPYRFLSNFIGIVTINGVKWPTVEHAYQASKTSDPNERHRILTSATPGEAKRLGKYVTMDPDFELNKLSIMRHLVAQKFLQNVDLATKLIETGDAYIEETNYWDDTFWGVCNGQGSNHLGKILMSIREQIC